MPKNKRPWICFHCDQKFTNREEATLHFGKSQTDTPVCQMDAAHIRKLESELASYRAEDTQLHREIETMRTKHAEECRRAEEIGYAKGLRDGRLLEPQKIP